MVVLLGWNLQGFRYLVLGLDLKIPVPVLFPVFPLFFDAIVAECLCCNHQ